MIGQEKALEWLELGLQDSQADQTELVLIANQIQLTRFANSAIHQNLSEANCHLLARAVIGKKVGCAATNRFSRQGIKAVIHDAFRIAQLQAENPDFHSLPDPRPSIPVDAFSQATARCTPKTRAAKVAQVVRWAKRAGGEASGSLSTGWQELAVANSLGVRAYHAFTDASLVAIVSNGDASRATRMSGYAEWVGTDLSDLDTRAVARRAVDKCRRSKDRISWKPGEYEVVLEPPAVAEMLSMLGYMGLGANSVREGRSFMCDKLGQQVVSEKICIWDDGFDRRGVPMPFDFEGVPKQRVDLIEHGVARSVVYDSYTGHLEGKESTGHALPAPNPQGPFPLHLVMGEGEGEATVEDMIASTERGILVTRFHYVNVVHPKETSITGMTRDGTWVIEKGKIKHPIKDLRFTQSVVAAFSAVDMVGKQAIAARGGFGDLPCLVPALKISKFAFTS